MAASFLPDNWRAELSPEDKQKLFEYLDRKEYALGFKERPFRTIARPKQLPPEDPKHHIPDNHGYKCGCEGGDNKYRIWLVLSGRGFGKTLCGANWIIEQALKYPGTKWGVAAPTSSELDSVCFNSDSGILAQLLPGELADYNVNKMRIKLSNGSTIQGYSADVPDRIRGANLHGLWFDEAGASRYPEFWYASARPAVRMEPARIVVTTTPRSTKLLRDLVSRNDGTVHITKGAMWENDALDDGTQTDLKREYGGTRLGRQELEGELLDDFEGALFSRDDIEKYRVKREDMPKLTRVVVGVDPAMKPQDEDHDESGIVVAGEGEGPDGQKHVYVLDDLSMRGTTKQVMQRVAAAYDKWDADVVVVEVNQGGDWIRDALRATDPNIPIRTVHAMRNKAVKARPAALLSEQGRLHMVGAFPELEDECCCLMPEVKSTGHDDRVDGLIYCIYELRHVSEGSYMDAYGMVTCPECFKTHSKKKERCPSCGHVRPKEPEVPGKPEDYSDRGWASAYVAHCEKCGGTYPRGKQCPRCQIDPVMFIARARQFGNSSAWSGDPRVDRALSRIGRKGY